MSVLPVYVVDFIPLERRLDDRRVATLGAILPKGISDKRRVISGRRAEDRKTPALKAI
jgi:hypothetical protein